MTQTYRAIEQYRFADSFQAATRISELRLPQPAPGEVLVRNAWCGINGIFDTQLARNAVGTIRLEPPFLTGVEAVGTVAAVGAGVTGLAVGDAVAVAVALLVEFEPAALAGDNVGVAETVSVAETVGVAVRVAETVGVAGARAPTPLSVMPALT